VIYLLSFAIVLGILIFVHEFGHFIVARRLGVGVTRFSFGFGPKLVGIRRGETEYRISAVPLGGYVKLVGESEGEDVSPEQRERSFLLKPVWVKMAVVLAGPLGNLLFAVLAFWVLFLGGVPTLTAKIGDVLPESPAAEAGLRKGDVVVRIDGKAVEAWEDLASGIRESGAERPVHLVVRRDGEEFPVTVVPELREGTTIFGEKDFEPRIGIAAGQEIVHRDLSPGEAFVQGVKETGRLVYLTALTVVKLVMRVIPSSGLGGPILIAQIAGEQAQQGLQSFLYFLGLLSVNLGILNLLPIPILDGGHLVFFAIEGLRRKPLSPQVRLLAQQVGLAIILMLTMLVFYNDIARIIAR
jgi:regulator of sigma E protease